MSAPACTVGRLGPDGPWVGFAPAFDDGYLFVVGVDGATHRSPAEPEDLLALAIAYFEEALEEPPEELAATHGDIGALVRHVAEAVTDPDARRRYAEAIDAIDDGLAADIVIERLSRLFHDGGEATARLRRRSADVATGA